VSDSLCRDQFSFQVELYNVQDFVFKTGIFFLVGIRGHALGSGEFTLRSRPSPINAPRAALHRPEDFARIYFHNSLPRRVPLPISSITARPFCQTLGQALQQGLGRLKNPILVRGWFLRVVKSSQKRRVLSFCILKGSIPLNRCKECFTTRIKSKQLVSVAAVPFASASSFVEWTRNEDAAGYIALHLTVYCI
jgi:hypothetical protein